MVSSHAIFTRRKLARSFLKRFLAKKVAKTKFRGTQSIREQSDNSTAAERRSLFHSNCEQWEQKIYSSSERVTNLEATVRFQGTCAGHWTVVIAIFFPSKHTKILSEIKIFSNNVQASKKIWRNVSGKYIFSLIRSETSRIFALISRLSRSINFCGGFLKY